jgi:hypothetical protein
MFEVEGGGDEDISELKKLASNRRVKGKENEFRGFNPKK